MADTDDASAVGSRPKTALMKRHEQLQRWKGSELDRERSHVDPKRIKVKFNQGCVFLAACASGDTDEVKKMLGKGADINYANVDGLTALHQVSKCTLLRSCEFVSLVDSPKGLPQACISGRIGICCGCTAAF